MNNASDQNRNDTRDQSDRATQDVVRACNELNNFLQQSWSAAIRSAEALTRGVNETTRNTGELMQENLSRALHAGRNMMDAKTLNEMMDAHSQFMRECFDCMMTGTGRMSEISARTTKEALEPVAQHANETVNKITQRARDVREGPVGRESREQREQQQREPRAA